MELTLERDHDLQWEIGNNAIDGTVEAMRDNLRDRGMEDGELMESIVMDERSKMQEELGRNIDGDFSQPYEIPDFDAITAELGLGDSELSDRDDSMEGLSDAEVDAICKDIET